MNKAVFLDRDGVINKDGHYIYKIEDFIFNEGIFELLKFFLEKNFILIVITNQAGIAKGFFTEEDFLKLNNWMLKEFSSRFIEIKKVYYSPYHPEALIEKYKKESFDRKPNPGMILKAKEEFSIDLSRSILIGDKESDILAGENAGIKKNILIKSEYNISSSHTKYIFSSILDLFNNLTSKINILTE